MITERMANKFPKSGTLFNHFVLSVAIGERKRDHIHLKAIYL
jgi:hypothetical protein